MLCLTGISRSIHQSTRVFKVMGYMLCLTGISRSNHQQVVRTRRHDLVICSYDVLRNDSEFFAELKWNYCVLDEGHVIKNTKTKVSQAIRGQFSDRQ